jgi:FkbM family methyltransferase
MLSQLIIRLRRMPWMERGKRFIPAALRRSAWRLAHRQEVFSVMGSAMFLPANSRHRDLVVDRYEPAVSKLIREYLKPGMTFVDVGANIGIFTLLGARLVGTEGRVLALEPMPDNFRILRANVALNGLSNVSCIPKAGGAAPGKARLFLSTYGGSHSMTENPPGFTGDVLEVDIVRLDAMTGFPHIDLLKIDVEGSELEVIEGLGRVSVGRIVLEYNSERMRQRGLSGEEFLRRLERLGCTEIQDIDSPDDGVALIRRNDETVSNLMMTRRVAPTRT